MKRGRSIKIFLTDGTPNGVKIAEISNWTGLAISSPRTKLPEIKSRQEANKPGVYILIGPDVNSPGDSIIYIGEGESVWNRLDDHQRNKDFWEDLVLFCNKDENLTKSHIRYLESRMIQEARNAKQAKVENGTTPDCTPLPEADREDMEVYFDHMKLLLGALGLRIFEKLPSIEGKRDKIKYFHLSYRKATAKGFIAESDFVIEKGSTAVARENSSLEKWYSQLRLKLVKNEQLIQKSEDIYEFSEDVSFSSPTAAAAVVSGTAISGPMSWKDDNGKFYKEVLEESIEKEEKPDDI